MKLLIAALAVYANAQNSTPGMEGTTKFSS